MARCGKVRQGKARFMNNITNNRYINRIVTATKIVGFVYLLLIWWQISPKHATVETSKGFLWAITGGRYELDLPLSGFQLIGPVVIGLLIAAIAFCIVYAAVDEWKKA